MPSPARPGTPRTAVGKGEPGAPPRTPARGARRDVLPSSMTGKRPPARRAAVVGALLLVQAIFGLHYVAAKIVLEAIPPLAWASIRVSAAAAVLLALSALLGRSLRFEPRDLGRLAAYALLGIAINQVCFVEGLHRTTPTHSSLINATIPVGTLALAVLLRRETADRWKLLAIAVSLAGVLLVVLPSGAATSSSAFAGDLLTLANGASYALFLVLSRRLLARSDPLAATTILLCFGAVQVLVVGAPALASFSARSVAPSIWLLAALIVLLATVLTYFLNYWALARVESSFVALFIYVQPILAASLSAMVLGERPGGRVLAGGALVFAGVALALRADRGAGQEPDAHSGASATLARISAPLGSTDSSKSNAGE